MREEVSTPLPQPHLKGAICSGKEASSDTRKPKRTRMKAVGGWVDGVGGVGGVGGRGG
jgi:hypothetical protein